MEYNEEVNKLLQEYEKKNQEELSNCWDDEDEREIKYKVEITAYEPIGEEKEELFTITRNEVDFLGLRYLVLNLKNLQSNACFEDVIEKELQKDLEDNSNEE